MPHGWSKHFTSRYDPSTPLHPNPPPIHPPHGSSRQLILAADVAELLLSAERAMSSSGSVRSLPGTRETPPFAFPVFCRTIGRVLDDEQGPRGNSERRGAGLALSPAIVDRLIGRGVNAVGISPRRGWPSAACAPHGATTRPMAPLKTTTMAVPGR